MTDEPTKADLIERIESLEEQQAEFAAEQEQVLGLFEQFRRGRISRRSFLTAVAAVGGVGLVAGRSRAAPSWGSSSGTTGTSSTPLSEGYIQTLKSQTVTTERAAIAATSAVAYQTTDQSISSSTVTKITLDSAGLDQSQVLNVDLANNKIIVQEAGQYTVACELVWGSDSGWTTGDQAGVSPFVNGSAAVHNRHRKVGVDLEGKRQIYHSSFAANDSIDMRAFQDSGGSKLTDSGQSNIRLEIWRTG